MDKTMRGYRQIPVWLKYLINALLLCTLLVLGNHIIVSGGVNRAQKAVILQIGIYILLAVSLNVATGYLGQLPYVEQRGFHLAFGITIVLLANPLHEHFFKKKFAANKGFAVFARVVDVGLIAAVWAAVFTPII